MPAKTLFPTKPMLIGVIADESTVTGFLLTGIGERNKKGESNFYIVNKDTTDSTLEQEVAKFLARDDIGILLIAQSLAERVRNLIVEHNENEEKLLPTILEIPSKDAPYDPEKDYMLKKVNFG